MTGLSFGSLVALVVVTAATVLGDTDTTSMLQRNLATASGAQASGLFAETSNSPIGASAAHFKCGATGSGTVSVAEGPGGCLNAQPSLAGSGATGIADKPTVESFLVYPCGMVAIHSHANAAEVNTVVHGSGIVGQFTTNSGQMEISEVHEGGSFFFAQGSYHWWINLGEEQLLTIGSFTNTADPDAALFGFDDHHGIVAGLMSDQSLLRTLIGESSGKFHTVALNGGSPLFPMLDSESCAAARRMVHQKGSKLYTTDSFQTNPSNTDLFRSWELQSGKYSISSDSCPVNGPGGGLRPLAGEVREGMPFVTGTASTHWNGGLKPTTAMWPGLTNVGGGMALVKFVVSYCGVVAIHTHVNAAEWNTVIEGEGQVAYWGVNGGWVKMHVKKGDSFMFPQGSAHYWVNYSPKSQLVTVGGFTAPFPDTSMLDGFLMQTHGAVPFITDAVLGTDFKPAAEVVPNTGADTLFPLLSTRHPKSCGGDVPCHSCQ